MKSVSLLYGGEAELPDLAANDQGGFDAYQPLAVIPGGSVVIIELGAVKQNGTHLWVPFIVAVEWH
jgi:hypothetical protein